MNTRNLRYVQAPESSGAGTHDGGLALLARAGQFAQRTARAGSDPRFTGSVSTFDPRAAGYQDPILVTASSGAGLKLKVAIATGMHETIGADLVANAANAVLTHGAEPLTFHYHHSCGAADFSVADRIVAGIAEGCRLSGVALSGGHTAEIPGVFEDGEYDLAGFCSGTVERPSQLPRFDATEGDVILGLAASGVHAHGFTQIRRIVSSESLGYRDPAPFAPHVSLGQALLQPTRAYAPIVGAVLREATAVKMVIPITEGGLQGSIAKMLPLQLAARIDLSSWRMPAMFQWFQRTGGLTGLEMTQSFNCGLGMIIVVDKLRTVSALKVLRDRGEKPLAIGTLVPRSGGDPVRFSGALTA